MSTTENPKERTREDLEALLRRLEKENQLLKSEKNRVGISFRRVPETGSQITALYDERFPYYEHVPENSYTLADRHADEESDGKELSQPTDGNTTLIEAENLAALSALQLTHQGKVDVIYIDPPYNTGNKDFVYNDARTSKIADAVDEEGNPLSAEDYEKTLDGNVRSVGRENPERHSLWLSFMEKRLWLAKKLLSDTGVIFVSIDDNEQARLKLLMDEVFGEENFLNQFVWVNKFEGRTLLSAGASGTKEYVLLYQMGKDKSTSLMLDNDYATRMMPSVYPKKNFETLHDAVGEFIVTHELHNGNSAFNEKTRPNLVYNIYYDPRTEDVVTSSLHEELDLPGYSLISPYKSKTRGIEYHAYRWSRTKVEKEKTELLFVPHGKTYKIYTKRRDASGVQMKDLLMNISASAGGRELNSIINGREFDFPKPKNLLNVLVKASSHPSALILDFFAGSGTTAHAVAELNKEDGGNRQCILVTHGDENGKNIAEDVTAERMKRVLSGKNWADGKEHDSLPGELNYYRLQFAEKVKDSYHAADVMKEKFIGYASLEQDVVLDKEQLDIEGAHVFSSSTKNVVLISDDFLLMDGSLEDILLNSHVDTKENVLYVPLSDDTDLRGYSFEGWKVMSFPASYMESHRSLIKLMKDNKTLLKPVVESESV